MATAKAKESSEQITKYADMFTAMGTEPRLRIMQLLLSHHLEKLKNEDLVKVRRDSTFLWYTANTEALQELLGFLYAECCTRNKAIQPDKIITLCK
jgi:hypothetical protein